MMSRKKIIHLVISLAICGLLKIVLPTNTGLTPIGASVLGVFAASIYMWLTVGVDWTSFLILGLLCLTGVASSNEIWALSWGNNIIPLVVSVMILNAAVDESGLAQKMARWFITRKVVQGKPYIFLAFFLLANLLASFVMGVTAVVIIFLSMAESIWTNLGYQKEDKFAKAMALGVMWVSVVGYGATPIGHAVPLMIVGLAEANLGVTVSFYDYMLVGIPLALIFFVIMMLVFRFLLKPDCGKFQGYDIEAAKRENAPLTKKGKIVAVVFFAVVFLWIAPDIVKYILPDVASFISSMGAVVPPFLAVALLCILRVDNAPVLDFKASIKKVSWSSVMFMTAINALGSCITMESAGIQEFLQSICQPLANGLPLSLLVAAALLAVTVLTNFMSCGVSGTLVYSAFVPVIMAIPNNNIPILGLTVLIAIMSNVAFMTPSANPTAPLVFGPGYVSLGEGMKYGAIMVAASYIVCMAVIWPLTQLVF